MRVALLAPPWITVPPTGYGGTESVVGLLADALAQARHGVTLLAASCPCAAPEVAEACRASARERFSPARVAARYAELYRAIAMPPEPDGQAPLGRTQLHAP